MHIRLTAISPYSRQQCVRLSSCIALAVCMLVAAAVVNSAEPAAKPAVEPTDEKSTMDSHDPDRPWLKDAVARHPNTEYWRAQARAHREQPRTPGWNKYEAYALSNSPDNDVLALPTFGQMLVSDRHPTRLIVKLDEFAEPLSVANDTQLIYERPIGKGTVTFGMHIFQIPESTGFAAAIESVNAHPGVIYAEPDYSISIQMPAPVAE